MKIKAVDDISLDFDNFNLTCISSYENDVKICLLKMNSIAKEIYYEICR